MENYKTIIYDPINFTPSELELPIPKELVDKVQKLMEEIDEEIWLVAPMMVVPNDLGVIFKVIEKNGNEYGSHYTIKINKDK